MYHFCVCVFYFVKWKGGKEVKKRKEESLVVIRRKRKEKQDRGNRSRCQSWNEFSHLFDLARAGLVVSPIALDVNVRLGYE
jgi:hypothetical protein